MFTLIALVGCDKDEQEQANGELEFCVRAAWTNGRDAHSTRALSATDLLDNTPQAIAFSDYPAEINVSCNDGQNFKLIKGDESCTDHSGFLHYTTNLPHKRIYSLEDIQNGSHTFTATATIDGGDRLKCTVTKANIVDNHLQFTLQHEKALLRFAFKVADKYAQIRSIRIKNITLNGIKPVYPEIKALDYTLQYLCYMYVDPKEITTSTNLTLKCTYDVYDKDALFTTDHLIRENVTTANNFQFNKLKDAGGNTVSTINAGKYYDLIVTIDPDFLYSMSNHDDKSGMKIQ